MRKTRKEITIKRVGKENLHNDLYLPLMKPYQLTIYQEYKDIPKIKQLNFKIIPIYLLESSNINPIRLIYTVIGYIELKLKNDIYYHQKIIHWK